jgi:hypothetical protein
MQGNTVKASAAYQDFLTLWKDADPDIPILKQAKAEYASCRRATAEQVDLRCNRSFLRVRFPQPYPQPLLNLPRKARLHLQESG